MNILQKVVIAAFAVMLIHQVYLAADNYQLDQVVLTSFLWHQGNAPVDTITQRPSRLFRTNRIVIRDSSSYRLENKAGGTSSPSIIYYTRFKIFYDTYPPVPQNK